jgi:hypothetical protein
MLKPYQLEPRVKDFTQFKQAGFHLYSFGAGALFSLVAMLLLGLGAVIFLAMAYDDEYTIALEPEWAVNALNQAQQAYYLQKGEFTNQIKALQGYPVPSQGHLVESQRFVYSVDTGINTSLRQAGVQKAVISYGIPRSATISYNYGVPVSLYGVVGAVFVLAPNSSNPNIQAQILVPILCKSRKSNESKPALPTVKNGLPTCGSGTQSVAP